MTVAKKRQGDPPIVVTKTQQREAISLPESLKNKMNSDRAKNRYGPVMERPDADLYHKEMIPLSDIKNEDKVKFIHFEDVEDVRADPVKIKKRIDDFQKKEDVDRKKDEDSEKMHRSVSKTGSHEIPKKSFFNPVFRSPWRYPFIYNVLRVKPEQALDINRIKHQDFYRPKLERVPRAYDEDFLRAPIPGVERFCVKGEHCIARQIPSREKVTLREYYLPSQNKRCKEDKCFPDDMTECLLCMLTSVNELYYDTKADQMGIEGDSVIAGFMHQVGIQGEYRAEDCMGPDNKKFMGLWGNVLIVKLFNYEYVKMEVKDSTGNLHVIPGFKLNLPYPSQENTGLFFRTGSLVLQILDEFVHSKTRKETECGTTL
jgi:hypothetical protein